MIRELFLPESLFGKNIIGLEINKTHIMACLAWQKKATITIQKIANVSIENDAESSYEQELVSAVRQALSKLELNKADYQIKIAIPNNLVFFKELTVPFLDQHQIGLILGYEIEASLPFSLSEAVFDFMLVKQNLIQKTSTILVAIAQKKQLDFYINIVKQANNKNQVDTITVDLLATVGLVSNIYQSDLNKYKLLLDLGKNSITISYLLEGKPLLVRNLPYGINNIVAKIASACKSSQKDIAESLFRFGLAQDLSQEQNMAGYFNKLIEDLVFTINSFQTQFTALTPANNLSQNNLLIVESALEIKDIANYLASELEINCENLNLSKINLSKKLLIAPNVTINAHNITCVNSVLGAPANCDFNLLPTSELDTKLVRYQMLTTLVVTIIILATIYGLGVIKNSGLANKLLSSKQQTLSALKGAFNNIDNNLNDAINQAETRVNEEKKLWFSFSNQNGYSTLRYLQELSSAIDMKKIDLDLKKLTIHDHIMTIVGSVEKFENLYLLEQALSNVAIFKSFTKSIDKNFTIKIVLKQSDRDLA
jgi:Tfp pilus assembly PilM family ATPase